MPDFSALRNPRDITLLAAATCTVIISYKCLSSFQKSKVIINNDDNNNTSAPENSKYVNVSGINIRYVDSGGGSNDDDDDDDNDKRVDEMVLVMIHGFLGCLETWELVTQCLTTTKTKTSKLRVISLDLVGNGFSEKPLGNFNYSLQNQGKIVSEFIETLELSNTILVGHSMGGVVAASAALLAANNKLKGSGDTSCQRIRGAILVAPGFYQQKPTFFSNPFMYPIIRFLMGAAVRKQESSLRNNPSYFSEEMIHHFVTPTKTPNYFEALVELGRVHERPYIEEMTNLLKITTSSTSSTSSNNSTKQHFPIHFVWATNDKIAPPSQADKINTLVNQCVGGSSSVSQVILDESSHYIQHDQPQKLASEIEQFSFKIQRK